MTRLIDADALKKQSIETDKWGKVILILDIVNAPTIEPKTAEWIPCSERLPEEGQGCLVCDKGQITTDTFVGHGNPYNWRWYVRDYEAWMPLPKPYKGGDTE